MQSRPAPLITKANGEREPFRADKLYDSLVNSGAPNDLADRIVREVADSIQDGDRTQVIYRKAFAKLRREERPLAARYSVKRALLDLGPSGYPFEDFLGEIYRVRGYQTSNRRVVQGRCVEHELDLIASKDNERIGAEVKFHNNHGIKSDIKVALYVHARFEDIKAGAAVDSEHDYTSRMVITNTKFSHQARDYAACVGLELLAWDYPKHNNLRTLIEETGVHPLSCLTTLTKAQKRHLMDSGVVLCRQVHNNVRELEDLGVTGRKMDALFSEVEHLCQT